MILLATLPFASSANATASGLRAAHNVTIVTAQSKADQALLLFDRIGKGFGADRWKDLYGTMDRAVQLGAAPRHVKGDFARAVKREAASTLAHNRYFDRKGQGAGKIRVALASMKDKWELRRAQTSALRFLEGYLGAAREEGVGTDLMDRIQTLVRIMTETRPRATMGSLREEIKIIFHSPEFRERALSMKPAASPRLEGEQGEWRIGGIGGGK
jgi:hypothetical protein